VSILTTHTQKQTKTHNPISSSIAQSNHGAKPVRTFHFSPTRPHLNSPKPANSHSNSLNHSALCTQAVPPSTTTQVLSAPKAPHHHAITTATDQALRRIISSTTHSQSQITTLSSYAFLSHEAHHNHHYILSRRQPMNQDNHSLLSSFIPIPSSFFLAATAPIHSTQSSAPPRIKSALVLSCSRHLFSSMPPTN
jgi:hypothetical protein